MVGGGGGCRKRPGAHGLKSHFIVEQDGSDDVEAMFFIFNRCITKALQNTIDRRVDFFWSRS